MHLLARVFANHILVQLDAQSWPARQREGAVHHLRQTRRRVFDICLGEVVEVFLNLEVGRTGGQMQRGGGRDRAADVVRRDQYVVGFGPGGELLYVQQPAEVGDVEIGRAS